VKLGRPDIERALLGGIIRHGQVHSFGDAQPTGVEEMVKGVMTVRAVMSPRVRRSGDPLLEIIKESPEFPGRKNIRTIRL
jgi:hypothetical protein